jgi:TetR/AcrR family transcriptional regulator
VSQEKRNAMKQSGSGINGRARQGGMQRILAAAVDEFCRAGLAGAKLDVIALEADVSKQLIHHYFHTKSELYLAVINEVTAEAIRELVAVDYEACEPDVAIRLFLQKAFDFFVRWPHLAGLYNDQGLYGGEHMPECREFVNRSPELMLRLEAVLKRGQASGIFRADIVPQESIALVLFLVIGCFTNGPILSSLIPIDFSASDNVERWREISIQIALESLRKR